jgi:hypothetical protein
VRRQKVCQRYAKSFRQPTDGREADVCSTLFKTGQTRLRDFDQLRQLRLRKTSRLPSLPELRPENYRVGIPERRATSLFRCRSFLQRQLGSRGSGRSRLPTGYGLLGRQAHVSDTSGRVVLNWYQEWSDSTSERRTADYDESPRFRRSSFARCLNPAFLLIRRTLAHDESPRFRQSAPLVAVSHPLLSHRLAPCDESPRFCQVTAASHPLLSYRPAAYDESPRFCRPIGFSYQTLIRVYWRFIVDNLGWHWRFIASHRFATLAIHRGPPPRFVDVSVV